MHELSGTKPIDVAVGGGTCASVRLSGYDGKTTMPLNNAVHLKLTTASHLSLSRCPHCFVANPNISRRHVVSAKPGKAELAAAVGQNMLQWHIYICETCAGLVAGATIAEERFIQTPLSQPLVWLVPITDSISDDVPQKAARYLIQARDTLSSPAASVVMSASAVDAMLKERGYREGSLYTRINAAEKAGVLTAHMAEWAHDVRLDANDERHADADASGATEEDASRCLEFATTLADLLFVLPARVKRGLKAKT